MNIWVRTVILKEQIKRDQKDETGEVFFLSEMSVVDVSDLQRLKGYEYVVFAGGAVRGISMCSAFCEVVDVYRREFDSDFVKKLKGTGGTSVGACLALAVLCGLSTGELRRLAMDHSLFDSDSLLRDANFSRFWEKGGLLNHGVLYEKIDRLFDVLDLPKDIDFLSLHRRTRKLFMCNASDLQGKASVFMSYKTTPYRKVRDALCMSMCLPMLFVGYEHNGIELCDGGIYNNYIVDQFPEGQVMGFAIDDTSPRRDPNLQLNGFEKALSLIKSLCNRIDTQNFERLSPEYRGSTVMIYTPGFEQIKVCANRAEACMLWEYGRMSVTWYFFGRLFVQWLLCKHICRFLKQLSPATAETPEKTELLNAS
jgi:predicted patatin/cPLA2 family phospholipase